MQICVLLELIANSPLSNIAPRAYPFSSAVPSACASTTSTSNTQEPSSSVFSHFKGFWQYFEQSSEANRPNVVDNDVERTNVKIQDSSSPSINLETPSTSVSTAQRISDQESERSGRGSV